MAWQSVVRVANTKAHQTAGWQHFRCWGVLTMSMACAEAPEPRFAAAVRLGGVEVSADVLNQGERLYRRYCASCHGEDGSGTGAMAKQLPFPPRDLRTGQFQTASLDADALPSDDDLESIVRDGRPARGMPGWAGLRPEDRFAVVQFIKTLSPRWQAPNDALKSDALKSRDR